MLRYCLRIKSEREIYVSSRMFHMNIVLFKNKHRKIYGKAKKKKEIYIFVFLFFLTFPAVVQTKSVQILIIPENIHLKLNIKSHEISLPLVFPECQRHAERLDEKGDN